MGTWNTAIKGSDAFLDIYQNFFALYNLGQDPADVSKQIQKELSEMFADHDERNNSLFGLALAQWETKSLDLEVYNQVKDIIQSDNDLEIWKGQGADDRTIKKRKQQLEKFLVQITTDRETPKRRVRPKLQFEKVKIVDVVAPDNFKRFEVNEEYTNKKYTQTSGLKIWRQGGGSVLYFEGQGKQISARWLDSQTLEITHDKAVFFRMQEHSAYFSGDEIHLIYQSI